MTPQPRIGKLPEHELNEIAEESYRQITEQPKPNKGELEYGSILPDGEDWRLRRCDAGMGETEYRIFRNEVFFCMCDNRKDADTIMGLMLQMNKNLLPILEEIRKGCILSTQSGDEYYNVSKEWVDDKIQSLREVQR